MLRLFFLAVLLLAAAGGAAYWTLARGNDRAEAQTQLWRWVNVTVEVPEDSGLVVSREHAGMTAPHPFLVIHPVDKRESLVAIDAETGEIAKDVVEIEDRAAIDAVLQTVKVSPFDPKTLPWPYNGEPPDTQRLATRDVTYIEPDPAAGIQIDFGMADPGGDFLEVNNGRSLVFISIDTGTYQWEPDFLVTEDKEVLERFVLAVEYKREPLRQYLPGR